jgi:hypothetical protein
MQIVVFAYRIGLLAAPYDPALAGVDLPVP